MINNLRPTQCQQSQQLHYIAETFTHSRVYQGATNFMVFDGVER